MTKIIIVDEDRCLGCKQCMIECAMAHSEAEKADYFVEAVDFKEVTP